MSDPFIFDLLMNVKSPQMLAEAFGPILSTPEVRRKMSAAERLVLLIKLWITTTDQTRREEIESFARVCLQAGLALPATSAFWTAVGEPAALHWRNIEASVQLASGVTHYLGDMTLGVKHIIEDLLFTEATAIQLRR
eukprot:TRINITY_DN7697_c0_g1_i1.p1 TRINITY_DN7697_c0_g1~~TRINITY_DN7697_c0_g1_i1.p1  ORF type:complete len:137 (+),score=23.58 TRINITY_DN7697_c0_g1_i1:107-517(+)